MPSGLLIRRDEGVMMSGLDISFPSIRNLGLAKYAAWGRPIYVPSEEESSTIA